MRGLDKDYKTENSEQMHSLLKEFEEKINFINILGIGFIKKNGIVNTQLLQRRICQLIQ
tara:strand:- start:285 stop:461 length:177 start_codon:yes stop_codon:yes gene_type:complete